LRALSGESSPCTRNTPRRTGRQSESQAFSSGASACPE
jgi:hypothetical protein